MYLFAENTLVTDVGDNYAREFKSPLIVPTQNEMCFTFFYYVVIDHANNSGLSLIIDTNHNTDIWYSGGMSADKWQKAEVTIQPQSVEFAVSIFYKLFYSVTN